MKFGGVKRSMDDDSADGLEIGYQFVKFYSTYTDGKEFINAI